MTPAQVHDDNSQPDAPEQGTVYASNALVEPSPFVAFTRRTGARSQVHEQCQAPETRTGPQLSRLRFDGYEYYRDIPNRQQLTAGGYYEYLAQQTSIPQTRDEEREHLKAIAESTRGHITTSEIPFPDIHKTPEKSVF